MSEKPNSLFDDEMVVMCMHLLQRHSQAWMMRESERAVEAAGSYSEGVVQE